MKTLYLVGGTMGVGKTTVCRELKQMLPRSVFLDGDWCWDMNPFVVNDETKQMVMDSICFLLNRFLHCSAFEHVIFGWVMHEQDIINELLNRLDVNDCDVRAVSLMCEEAALVRRLQKDVDAHMRTAEMIPRSVARLPLYQALDTLKIDTTGKTIHDICLELLQCSGK